MNGDALTRLLDWRKTKVAAGSGEAGQISEPDLSTIVRSGRTAPSEIETMLPRQSRGRGFGAEIAALLTAPATSTSTTHTAPPRPGSGPGGLSFVPTDAAVTGYTDVPSLAIEPDAAGYRLRWHAPAASDGQVSVYRVVARDDREPHKPEAGTEIAVTSELSAHTTGPNTSAVRYLQVWGYVGDSRTDAAKQQPSLVARGQIRMPVEDFRLFQDLGQVIGSWSARPGTVRVRVLRIPKAALSEPNPERFRILADQDLVYGFTDTTALPGGSYIYRAHGEVRVGSDIVLTLPVDLEIDIQGTLSAVTDLRCLPGGSAEHAWIDLEWTPPTVGEVAIYRTENPPRPGAADAPMPESALQQAGLADAAKLNYAVRPGPPDRMTQIAWPTWDFVHLTPVTVLNGQARVGVTTTATRPPGRAEGARIVERGNEQVLTFGWPGNADEVLVYQAAIDVPVDHATAATPVAEIDQEAYHRDGGLHFPFLLPGIGCDIHLVPVTRWGRTATLGTVSTVRYPGLIRIYYRLQLVADNGENWMRITLSSPERDIRPAPHFVLVHHPQRLPLSIADGTELLSYVFAPIRQAPPTERIEPVSLATTEARPEWLTRVSGLHGFVRLFVVAPAEHDQPIAVIDPPLSAMLLADAKPRR
jgi:hypothetical protein